MRRALVLPLLWAAACSSTSAPDAGGPDVSAADVGVDAGEFDAGAEDSGGFDAAIPDTGPGDAGPEDTGVFDAGVPDAGPALCADPDAAVPPACLVPADCGDDLPPPTNCGPCLEYNRALCVAGACEMPPVLMPDDVHTIVLTVAPDVSNVESFAAFAVAEGVAGDRKLTCEDFYLDRVDLASDCVNVLDTRAYTLPQTGDTYAVSFGQFASGQRTLFLVYGHRGANPRGARLGVSCTAIDVGPPQGGGPFLHAGEPMVRLP